MSKTTPADLCFHQGGIEPHRSATIQDLIEAVESIGLRVAGPDDLLIRREDIDYEAAKRAAFEVAEQIAQARYEGQRFSLTEVNDLKVRAAVDAALAAAEGGEDA